jgi:hypothetical protein
VNKIKHVNQKTVIIGGRNARNSAAELQYTSGWTFAVSSFVKSGAGMSHSRYSERRYYET